MAEGCPVATFVAVTWVTTGSYCGFMAEFIRCMFVAQHAVRTRSTKTRLIFRMRVARAVVPIVCRLRVTHLTNAVIGFFTAYIGSAEYHLPIAATGRVYIASDTLKIRAFTAVLIVRGTTGVADDTIVNMMIFGNSKRPGKGNHEKN
jgi:hypothetical protein